MTTTLTNGTVTVTPDEVNGYESTQTVRTVVHRVLGRPDPDVTLRPAATRAGRLELVFGDEVAAAAAVTAHAAPSVWSIATTDIDTIDMAYVVADGDITRNLDDSRVAWLVSIPFVEVAP